MIAVLRLLVLVCVLALPLASARAADGQSQWAGVDGALVHYKSWGTGETAVVLIHGWGGDLAIWDRQVPALKAKGRVVAVDMPGHGQSGAPEMTYSLETLAKGVAGAIEQAGVKRAVLVGHSMGFPVALSVAQQRPGLVKGVVSMDGAILTEMQPEEQAWFAQTVDGMKGPQRDKVVADFIAPFAGKLAPADKKRILDRILATPAHVTTSAFENFPNSQVWAASAKFPFPVLGLYARLSEKGVADWLNARFATVQLKVWDDVDHWPHVTQPKRVNGAILAFLKTVPMD